VLKPGADAFGRGDPQLREGSGGRLQVPAPDLVRRRAAEGADREDSQEGCEGARGGRSFAGSAIWASKPPRKPSPSRVSSADGAGTPGGANDSDGRTEVAPGPTTSRPDAG